MRPTLPAAGFYAGLLSACVLPPFPLWLWPPIAAWVPVGTALGLYLLAVLGLLFFRLPGG